MDCGQQSTTARNFTDQLQLIMCFFARLERAVGYGYFGEAITFGDRIVAVGGIQAERGNPRQIRAGIRQSASFGIRSGGTRRREGPARICLASAQISQSKTE